MLPHENEATVYNIGALIKETTNYGTKSSHYKY